MTFEEFYAAIDAQVEKTAACAGHAAFKNDVQILKNINTGYGLPAITAKVWLKQICELTDEALLAYAEKYQAGWLNAINAHLIFVGK